MGAEAVAGVRRGGDVAALTDLIASQAETTVLDSVEGLHRAIAGRVFAATPGSAVVRVGHDAVSRTVYAGVRTSLRAVRAAGAVVTTLLGADRPVRWLDGGPGRAAALSALHGVVGDRFEHDHPALDLPVRIRAAGGDVALTTGALAAAFPTASGRVAVFVHGLTHSDRSWDRRVADPDGPPATVLPDVVEQLGWTAVRVRYGTGRAIGRNGAELAELLEAVTANWPVEIGELCLVGHSMGGLVIRSAGAVGTASGHRWPRAVSHTVSLGTPHLGSWLERAADTGTRLLRHVPEGEVVAELLDLRSRGIKDLGHGVLDEGTVPPIADAPLLPDATHHLVAGRVTASPDHLVTRVVGDLLVTRSSALGDDGRRRLGGGRIVLLEVPARHVGLLHDPAVADHLRRWLR